MEFGAQEDSETLFFVSLDAHQTLVLNGLRTGIVLETDGQLRTGRDVVLAALLFGALYAGGTTMEAATQVPSDIVEVLQGLIVLFVAAPPLIRAMFRLRKTGAAGFESAPKGWNA